MTDKRKMTDEHRKALSESMKAYWVEKKENQWADAMKRYARENDGEFEPKPWKFCPHCGGELK
jgi:hypothetical protein